MKRILSLILATLLATSALVACETTPAETESKETVTPATDPVATDAPETDELTAALITENGVAKSHIVVAAGADQLLTYAAEELAYHIKLVSGAEVATVTEASADSMPIIIATPDTNPELNDLFADDMVWLTTLEEDGKRYGSDGFAIRQHDGKLYIFGSTPRGALNGVYDFIEDNMGVLWIRAEENNGTVYDEMPTITLSAVNYREKSPFEVRGWHTFLATYSSDVMMSRNKLNGLGLDPQWLSTEQYATLADMGVSTVLSAHNITWWITNSPSYDPDCMEYWSTNEEGEHVSSASASQQVNYWSDLTAACIADSVIALLDANAEQGNIEYVGVNLEDCEVATVYPEMTEPYEYAPGQFVDPGAENYISTVYFSFLNKIARLVGEKYPNVKIHSYAYGSTLPPVACEIEDNLYITIAPVAEDLCAEFLDSPREDANYQGRCILDWAEITPNIMVYGYYGCYSASPFYERPIWDRMQFDLQLYAANGFTGPLPQGVFDGDMQWLGFWELTDLRAPYMNRLHIWDMNAMTFWIYAKLAWNPDEDVDALIEYYCDKMYGEASAYMQEYYRLLELGWADGRETIPDNFNFFYVHYFDGASYLAYFLDIEVDGVHILSAIREALHNAYDVANDKQKERLRYVIEIYDDIESLLED